MKHEQRERIIEILTEYGEMIGTDSEQTNLLIVCMKRLNCTTEDRTLEVMIKNELAKLCEIIGYANNKENNSCRKKELIAMRDVIARLIFDKYGKYPMITYVVADFFDKDRTTGISMDKRSSERLEIKDKLFMYHYHKFAEEHVELVF